MGEIAGCRLSPWPPPHGWGAIPRHRNHTRSRSGSKSRWLGPGPARCLFCSRSSLCRKERTYSPTVQLAPAVIGRGGLAKGNAGGAGGAVAVLAVQAVRRCGDAAAAAWWRWQAHARGCICACLLWPCLLYLLWRTAARLYARAVRKEPFEKALKLQQPCARHLSSKW